MQDMPHDVCLHFRYKQWLEYADHIPCANVYRNICEQCGGPRVPARDSFANALRREHIFFFCFTMHTSTKMCLPSFILDVHVSQRTARAFSYWYE